MNELKVGVCVERNGGFETVDVVRYWVVVEIR